MDNFEKFYNRALRFLSFRPRSEQEIRDYLVNKKAEATITEKIISKLREKRFLDDEEFVKWWIDQRTRVKPRAIRVIKMELKRKGIHHELIEAAFFDAHLRIKVDLESAKKLARRKIERYRNLPSEQVYQKVGRFLSSKGFSYDTIKKVLSNVDD